MTGTGTYESSLHIGLPLYLLSIYLFCIYQSVQCGLWASAYLDSILEATELCLFKNEFVFNCLLKISCQFVRQFSKYSIPYNTHFVGARIHKCELHYEYAARSYDFFRYRDLGYQKNHYISETKKAVGLTFYMRFPTVMDDPHKKF